MCLKGNFFKPLVCFVIASLLSICLQDNIVKIKYAHAATPVVADAAALPALSDVYDLPSISGVRFNVNDPLNLEFVFDRGTDKIISESERSKLIRYFLAALTVPEDKLWVNLSPYENDRIIDNSLVATEIGETLLNQDYLLKQLSSSITHPDTEIGENYWNNSRAKSDAFNKIWISPEKIRVLDKGTLLMIDSVDFRVQTESDYLATQTNSVEQGQDLSATKDFVLPALHKEVNQARNFALLRQMVNSVILGQLFKKKFGNTLFSFYIDSEKLAGVEVADPLTKNEVFAKYVEAFENGSYDVVKKVFDELSQRKVKKRYFSGGARISSSVAELEKVTEITTKEDQETVSVRLNPEMEQSNKNAAGSVQHDEALRELALNLRNELEPQLKQVKVETGIDLSGLAELINVGEKITFDGIVQEVYGLQFQIDSSKVLTVEKKKLLSSALEEVKEFVEFIKKEDAKLPHRQKKIGETLTLVQMCLIAITQFVIGYLISTGEADWGYITGQNINTIMMLIVMMASFPSFHANRLYERMYSSFKFQVSKYFNSAVPSSEAPLDMIYVASEYLEDSILNETIERLKTLRESDQQLEKARLTFIVGENSYSNKDSWIEVLGEEKVAELDKIKEEIQTAASSIGLMVDQIYETEYKTSGGIDLKDMMGNVELEQVSSAIELPVEVTAKATGMSFTIIGKPQIMPIKTIISS